MLARGISVTLLLLVIAVFVGEAFGNFQANIDICRPQQIHLSYGHSSTEVIVMWSTTGECKKTMVKYRRKLNEAKIEIQGDSILFSEPWNKEGVQHIHRVVLTSLEPNTMFYYEPISNQISAGPYMFKTPPASTDIGETSIQILALGDLNSSSPVYSQLIEEAQTGKYSAIIHTGNMAMNMSGQGGKNGDLYLKMMESILKEVPYLTSPGPTESDNGTFTHYRHRFSMPSTEWPMRNDRLWYSVDLGPVHLVSYSAEILYTDGGKYTQEHIKWLQNNLETANRNRKKTPWIVAFGHCPMYCASEDPNLRCNKKKSKIASQFEDVLFNKGVDLIVSSYGKSYEISYPMVKGEPVGSNYTNPNAPVHVTLGSASPWKSSYNFTKETWLNYLHDNETQLTFGRLNIHNSSLLRFEMVSFQSLTVLDSITIEQNHHGQFSKKELPDDVSAKIGKTVPVSETKTVSTIRQILQEGSKSKLIIGVSVGGGVLLILVAVLIVRKVMRGRRRQSSRRWENMDINYGKRYYNKAPDKDDLENDFEIDMTETTAPSRKLLSDD